VRRTPDATADYLPLLRELCDQQFWLFGRDIYRQSGNLLVEAGFERRRFGLGRPTQYVFEGGGSSISLWGFGFHWICHDRRQAIFVSRDGAFVESGAPVVLAVRDPWVVGRRLRLGGEADRLLASEVCGWFAAYEAWVAETAGPEHRAEALEGWTPCCGAGQTVPSWNAHSRRFRDLSHAVESG